MQRARGKPASTDSVLVKVDICRDQTVTTDAEGEGETAPSDPVWVMIDIPVFNEEIRAGTICCEGLLFPLRRPSIHPTSEKRNSRKFAVARLLACCRP
jgi:hypothetical protein